MTPTDPTDPPDPVDEGAERDAPDTPAAPAAPGSLDEITHRRGRRALATGRVAGSALRLAARRLRKAPGDDGVDAAIGARLARELDQMKGLAMKVGQIISYFDGLLPPETHRALQALQRGAQPVAFDVMARVIEDAFGQPVDALFDDIDRAPVAAASIGQVYRARLPAALAVNGWREVAVKVQYPNVRKTLASDFRGFAGCRGWRRWRPRSTAWRSRASSSSACSRSATTSTRPRVRPRSGPHSPAIPWSARMSGFRTSCPRGRAPPC